MHTAIPFFTLLYFLQLRLISSNEMWVHAVCDRKRPIWTLDRQCHSSIALMRNSWCSRLTGRIDGHPTLTAVMSAARQVGRRYGRSCGLAVMPIFCFTSFFSLIIFALLIFSTTFVAGSHREWPGYATLNCGFYQVGAPTSQQKKQETHQEMR